MVIFFCFVSTWFLLLHIAPFFFFFILQARERELVNARKAEEEYRRLEHLTLSGRLYRQEEEMRRNEQEARERRLGIREHDQSLEKVEAQTSGESGGVVNVFTDTSSGCGVGGNGKSYHEWNKIILNDTSSSSSSGMGIPGRVSIGSSLGSLVFQCRERLSWGVDDALKSRMSQSATGPLGSTAGVSSAPSRSDESGKDGSTVTTVENSEGRELRAEGKDCVGDEADDGGRLEFDGWQRGPLFSGGAVPHG